MPANRSVSSKPWRRPSSSSDARAEASIERDTSKRPRSASSTAWQRIDVASTEGDAVVMRSSRTTSRHRPPARATGLGPNNAAIGRRAEHEGDAPRVVGRAGRAQREVEHGFRFTDPAEAGEDPGPHLVRLRLTGAVAQRLEGRGSRGRGRVGVEQRVGSGQADQLGFETRGPRRELGVRAGHALAAPRRAARRARRRPTRAGTRTRRSRARPGSRPRIREAPRAHVGPTSRPSRGRRAPARAAPPPTTTRRRGVRAGRCRRRRSRARCGTGRPVRSDSAIAASCSPISVAAAASVHSPTRWWRSARLPLRRRRYAASRMSTWWNRCTGSSPQYVPVGSTSSLRRMASSNDGTASRGSASSRSAPRLNSAPITDANSSTCRSSVGSRSTRAASSDWIVGGTSTASASIVSSHSPSAAAPDDVVAHQHAHELAHEQRVAVGRCGEPLDQPGRQADRCRADRPRVARLRPGRARRGRARRRRAARSRPTTAAPRVARAAPGTSSITAAPSIHSARCSNKSRSLGSAHWMSSITMTTGRSVASDSIKRRMAQNVSSTDRAAAAPYTPARTSVSRPARCRR